MSRIDEYEEVLADLERRLNDECTELRGRLDSVYDRDPADALEATQALTEVFRKLKTLKDKGETMRTALDALREMARLKAEVKEKISELGPEYARYCMARASLAGEGDQELQALFEEAREGFQIDYGELEGEPIGGFRALDPESFEAAEEHEAALGRAPDPAPAAPDPRGLASMLGSTEGAGLSGMLQEEAAPAATPFGTQDSFEEEAGDELADTFVGERSMLVPDSGSPQVPETADPAPDVAAAAAVFAGGGDATEAEPAAEPVAEAAPVGAMEDEPDPVEAMRQVFGDDMDTGLEGVGSDEAPQIMDAAAVDAALAAPLAADPQGDTIPGDDAPPAEMGSAAADLLSMMDDDDDDDLLEAPPALAADPGPVAEVAAPAEEAPAPDAGAAASLLAELDDDDDDPWDLDDSADAGEPGALAPPTPDLGALTGALEPPPEPAAPEPDALAGALAPPAEPAEPAVADLGALAGALAPPADPVPEAAPEPPPPPPPPSPGMDLDDLGIGDDPLGDLPSLDDPFGELGGDPGAPALKPPADDPLDDF